MLKLDNLPRKNSSLDGYISVANQCVTEQNTKEVEVKVLIEALKNEKHCDSFYLK